MGHDDSKKLQELFDEYGPEVLLIYIKGACIRAAAALRQKTGTPSVFALGHELIAKGLQTLLEGKKK